MKKVSMKKVELSKLDKAIDNAKGLKEGSKADIKMDKKEQKILSKKGKK